MMVTEFTRALDRLGIPIFGVSIGKDNDRTTWRIDYKPEATAGQRSTGDSLKQTYTLAGDDAEIASDNAADAIRAQAIKAVLATLLDVKLNRRLTTADLPALRAMFDQTQTYYKFILNNNL